MINKLTKDQKQQLAVYRDQGIQTVLKTRDPEDYDWPHILSLLNQLRQAKGFKALSLKDIQIFQSPMEAVRIINGKQSDTSKHITYNNAFFGNQDADWLFTYKYYRDVLGLEEEVAPLNPLIELMDLVGWFWSATNRAVFTKLPTIIHTRPGTHVTQYAGTTYRFIGPKVHNDNGPAIQYANGDKLYFLNNVNISEEYSEFINTPADQLDPKKVLTITNADVRAAIIQKMGIDKVWDKLDKTIIHQKEYSVGGKYDLVEIQWNEDAPARKYLKMTCPSKKDVRVEAVHPKCLTVDQARAWRGEGGPIPEVLIFAKGFEFFEPKIQS